jgi:uncharacterized protein
MVELTVLTVVGLLVAGVFIGMASGLVGVGGGILIVPLLVLAFHVNQKLATGTSLALIMFPVGAMAVFNYHQNNNVDWRVVALLAPGFVGGAFLGARLVNTGAIPENALKIIFAALLVYTAYMLLSRAVDWFRGTTGVVISLAVIAVVFWVLKLTGSKLAVSSKYGELYRKHIARRPGDDFVI